MTNRQINLDDTTPVAELKFENLDSRYKSAHILGTSVIYILLMLLALLLSFSDYPWSVIIAEGVIAAAFMVNLCILPKSYFFKGYAFREHDLTYRSGIIFPKVTTIPYSKIQQVSLKQNPISRMFSLYSVEIVNGAQALSSVSIPGLTEEKALEIKNLVTGKIRKEND